MPKTITDNNFLTSKGLPVAKGLLIISLTVFFLPLVILPFFNHACTDDYFGGYHLTEAGFINYQIFVYTQWAGRFIATLVGSLFFQNDFLFDHYYFHSLLLLLLNFVSLLFLISTIEKYILQEKWSLPRKALISVVFLALEVCCVPQVVTFLFWFSSSLTYHPPVILIQTEIALFIILLNATSRKGRIISAVILPFLVFMINAFNELYIIVQLFLFFGIFWMGLHKRLSLLFNATMLFAFALSAAIVIFAPGDQVRMTGIVPKGILVGAIAVLYHSGETLWSILKNPLVWFVLTITFLYGKRKGGTGRIGLYMTKLSRPSWLLPVSIILFLITSIGLPVAALKGGLIPERYLNGVAYFVLLLLLMYVFLLGVDSKSVPFSVSPLKQKTVSVALLAIGIVCNTYVADAYTSLIVAPAYHSILKERETTLKDARIKNATAEVKSYDLALQERLQTDYASSTKTLQQFIKQKPPLLFFEDDLSTQYSVNVLKNYYGVDSIAVRK
jgi:hypothetical protein